MLLELNELEQGSPQWHDARRGIVTASVVGRLLAVATPDPLEIQCQACGATAGTSCVSLTRKTPTPIKAVHEPRTAKAASLPPVRKVADNDMSRGLTAQLAAERVAGFTEETPMNSDMYRGVFSEPYARDLYSEHYAPVREIGFMRRDESDWTLGFSPDGLVGNEGAIEIKAPRAKTHVLTIVADEVPAHYMPQLQAGLLVSGRKWIDFVSFCGGLPLWRKRVEPDPVWFDVITRACIAFEADVARIVSDYEPRVIGLPMTERIDTINFDDIKVA